MKISDTQSQSVSFNGYVSFEDFKTICQNVNPQKKLSRIVTIMVVAAIALQIWLIKISILQRVFCLVGAGFILWLMFWGIDKSGIKQQKKMYEKNSGSRMGMTSSSGIHLKFTNADIDFKWENFVDYRMLNQLLVLIDVDKQFLGLASYMFSSKGDWESFVRIVEHNLKKI